MCLVNHNHADLPHTFQLCHKQVGRKSFGRNVKEFVCTQNCIVEHTNYVITHHARIDRFGFDATLFQLLHLVFHQRDEWCDHNTHPFEHQRRHLKTDALTTSRGHQPQGVATLTNALNNLTLDATKRVIAPVFLQYVKRFQSFKSSSWVLISSISNCTSPCLRVFSSTV